MVYSHLLLLAEVAMRHVDVPSILILAYVLAEVWPVNLYIDVSLPPVTPQSGSPYQR
jgi:hypothetical protein